jgi:hypothetical protein
LNPGPFRALIATCSFAVTRRGTVSLSSITKTTSLPPAFPMRRFILTSNNGLGEDEDPWIPRPLSLPSEDTHRRSSRLFNRPRVSRRKRRGLIGSVRLPLWTEIGRVQRRITLPLHVSLFALLLTNRVERPSRGSSRWSI